LIGRRRVASKSVLRDISLELSHGDALAVKIGADVIETRRSKGEHLSRHHVCCVQHDDGLTRLIQLAESPSAEEVRVEKVLEHITLGIALEGQASPGRADQRTAAILHDARLRTHTFVVEYRQRPIKSIRGGLQEAVKRAGLAYGREGSCRNRTRRRARSGSSGPMPIRLRSCSISI
jgi:hypothetical protein